MIYSLYTANTVFRYTYYSSAISSENISNLLSDDCVPFG